MGVETNINTEQKILEAAESVFELKGYDGARMQEIAETAGINKGLLHYYFKTKDALFEAIFNMAFDKLIGRVTTFLEMPVSLEEKIGLIVDQYMVLLLKNPSLPRFVLNELNKNADAFIAKHISKKSTRAAFESFSKSVRFEVAQKKIRPIDPKQLFINMMSLLIFPFIGRPLFQTVTGSNDTAFRQLIIERKQHVKEFLKNALTLK